MSARSSTSGRRSADAAPLALGVNGRLSNQEMEQLKHQLAAAVAYDHVPEDKRADRHSKPTTTPMTRIYRKVPPPEGGNINNHKGFRPSIKPQASIEYEKRFTEGAYDALHMRPAPRGISASAKTLLQDEYVTRPREISVIPRNHHADVEHGASNAVAIPQVFIL